MHEKLYGCYDRTIILCIYAKLNALNERALDICLVLYDLHGLKSLFNTRPFCHALLLFSSYSGHSNLTHLS